jgi:NIMA (never in mitosis gene a)-related kinase
MEYVDGGDLAALLAERRGRLLSEDDALKIFIQLVVALKYVHSRKVIHRDLKPQNIFLTRVGVVKLGDFGVSRTLESSVDLARTRCGTPYYLSPEIWDGQAYNSQADIWSAGCVLYELCTLQKPFQGQNVNQLLVAILQSRYQPLSSRYTDDLRSLVGRMLSQTPTDRPTAADILQLPFITARLVVMIRENQSQLETVNLMSSRAGAVKTPKRKLRRRLRKKIVEPQLIVDDTDLPLPDEKLPRWAQRSMREMQKGLFVVAEQPDDPEDTNEWLELSDATDCLRESLTELPDDADAFEDEDELQGEIDRIRGELEDKLTGSLFEMLYSNLQQEEIESARDFIEIMEAEDPDVVTLARRLVALERVP